MSTLLETRPEAKSTAVVVRCRRCSEAAVPHGGRKPLCRLHVAVESAVADLRRLERCGNGRAVESAANLLRHVAIDPGLFADPLFLDLLGAGMSRALRTHAAICKAAPSPPPSRRVSAAPIDDLDVEFPF